MWATPPAHVWKMHTGNAGKVLKWSGPLDPYPTYALGTIATDSYGRHPFVGRKPGGRYQRHS